MHTGKTLYIPWHSSDVQRGQVIFSPNSGQYYGITQSIKYSERASSAENERSTQLKRNPMISDHRGNVQIPSLDSHLSFPSVTGPVVWVRWLEGMLLLDRIGCWVCAEVERLGGFDDCP